MTGDDRKALSGLTDGTTTNESQVARKQNQQGLLRASEKRGGAARPPAACLLPFGRPIITRCDVAPAGELKDIYRVRDGERKRERGI